VIKPYSVFRDKLGGDLILEFGEDEVPVKSILERLEVMFSISKVGVKPIVIVNDSVVNENYIVKGSYIELYLVPPFSGG